jgi:putative transposase
MSIDKDVTDRLMEGPSPGDLSSKTGVLAELTKALAERTLNTQMDIRLGEERAKEAPGT